jgi:hypothetical protein
LSFSTEPATCLALPLRRSNKPPPPAFSLAIGSPRIRSGYDARVCGVDSTVLAGYPTGGVTKRGRRHFFRP